MNIFSDGIGQLLSSLSTREDGLTTQEAYRKQAAFGKNQLPEKKVSLFFMFIKEFKSPLIIILIGCAFLLLTIARIENGTITPHDLIEPAVILAVVFINAAIGFLQEWKSIKSISALKTLQPSYSTVLRDNEKKQIPSEDIVPGDIIFFSEGEKISADIRLMEAIECRVNESMLTGESIAVEKYTYPPDSEGGNMLFSGTILVAGRAKGVVVSIGEQTKLGSIAQLLSHIESPATPLEKKIESLSQSIGKVMIGICICIFIATFFQGVRAIDALITSVAIAVAAIPEGLPVIVTLALSIGVSSMARRQMLVRDLKAIEALGNITVIASDKTGTITQNVMSVQKIFAHAKWYEKNTLHDAPKVIMQAGWYCNDAVLPYIGDPTEIALLAFAKRYEYPNSERIEEIPFSSDRKWMSTTQLIDGSMVTFVKGAPEMVATHFNIAATQELEAAETMAKEGLRTLMMIAKRENEGYECLGVVGLQDPPRENVQSAIAIAKNAGIRTMMITGDHLITAKAIAQQVGIEPIALEGKDVEIMSDQQLQESVKTVSLFARVTPAHKVRICKALQANGEVVAMTGDGVNDAPALTQAEVGIAMGKVGTDVARNASDMVVIDDDFSSIVAGVEEGRRIFDNIKKSILFLLSTNFSEILIFMLSLAFGMPLPLIAIQILCINLLTDAFPALAMVQEPAERNNMTKKPISVHESIFGAMLPKLLSISSLVGVSVFIGFWWVFETTQNLSLAQSFAFAMLSLLEMMVVLSIRSNELIIKNWLHNKWMLIGVMGSMVLTIAFIHSPLRTFLFLQPLSAIHWIVIATACIIVLIILEGIKWMWRK